MTGILTWIGFIIQFGAPIIAAVYAYKSYQLVQLERNIRIARESSNEGEQNSSSSS
ncbi:hypothetical protein [Emergencia timonensis]|uniref:hypothetical protein n=1 Tax=Emergencia timonensis TaxID=1776384 RepID=UPI0039954E28